MNFVTLKVFFVVFAVFVLAKVKYFSLQPESEYQDFWKLPGGILNTVLFTKKKIFPWVFHSSLLPCVKTKRKRKEIKSHQKCYEFNALNLKCVCLFPFGKLISSETPTHWCVTTFVYLAEMACLTSCRLPYPQHHMTQAFSTHQKYLEKWSFWKDSFLNIKFSGYTWRHKNTFSRNITESTDRRFHYLRENSFLKQKNFQEFQNYEFTVNK